MVTTWVILHVVFGQGAVKGQIPKGQIPDTHRSSACDHSSWVLFLNDTGSIRRGGAAGFGPTP